ncbi:MAG TPA: DUF1330 domain-containing protein [Kiloniellaceae bacterium]|nr:DUF1330 domain-containing protein [Kiloniellaceae bacterium]
MTTDTATTYAVAYLNVRDPETFGRYREQAGEALAKHGGRVAVAVPKPIRLEGAMETPGTMVLLEFDSLEGAERWHADPDLADIHDLRRKGAEISIFVLKDSA